MDAAERAISSYQRDTVVNGPTTFPSSFIETEEDFNVVVPCSISDPGNVGPEAVGLASTSFLYHLRVSGSFQPAMSNTQAGYPVSHVSGNVMRLAPALPAAPISPIAVWTPSSRSRKGGHR